MPFLLLLLIFLLFDFSTLFMLGHWIGGLYAFLIMIATAVIGVQLIRHQGLTTLRQAQARFLAGENSSDEVMRGVSMIFAGMLLMLPGTLTDLLAMGCLLPVTNRLLTRRMLGRTARSGIFSGRFQDIGAGPGEPRDRGFDEGKSHHEQASRDPHGQPLEGDYIEHERHRDQ
ncbi:UPF0716 protein FxsA [Kushneria sinocarnis]|uniref:UPF0716 protein FxsA n=1 Tax=Kushneria sinocarnis TaxID=595502 RepID=A0A420WV95_9GAMM|nr:FxsA family protein [Kushneria sinocarnis]RKR02465.1 UPF0716 protein FxsA [Kushneria sinocarnis]